MKKDNKWHSYFSKINWTIKKIKINSMLNVRDMIKEELNKDVIRIFKIMKKNPRIFRIELNDGTVLRFEIISLKDLHKIEIQDIASMYHDGTPKVIFYKIVGKKIFKFSEWIHGKLVTEIMHLEKVNVKTGELLGKLNNIKDPKTGLFITNGEISSTNLIWTKDEKVFSIDQGQLCAVSEKNLDIIVVKTIVKRIRYKDRSDMFLKGYSKYRDISGVLKIGNEKKWKWGHREMIPPYEEN